MRTFIVSVVLLCLCFQAHAQKPESDAVNDTCKIAVPNVVTPNGHGISKFFVCLNFPVKDLKLTIYNRWGEVIYTTTSFGKKGEVDWKYENLSEDVYVWMITYSAGEGALEQKMKQTGHVTVLK